MQRVSSDTVCCIQMGNKVPYIFPNVWKKFNSIPIISKAQHIRVRKALSVQKVF